MVDASKKGRKVPDIKESCSKVRRRVLEKKRAEKREEYEDH